MANNITNIYFSNTFGDLVRTANNLVNAWNYLGFYNWEKPTGRFTLSSKDGDGFVANCKSVFYYDTIITGAGYLQVDNNAEVKKTLTLSNTRTDLLCLDSRGIANLNYINVTNTGTSMVVSGNANFQKSINVTENVNSNYIYINYGIIDYNLFGNTANFSSNVYVSNFVSNNHIYANYDINSNRNISATFGVYAKTLNATETTSTDVLQADTSANTDTLSVSNTTFTRVLQANTSANTNILSVSNTTFTRVLQANTSANTDTLSVFNTTFTKNLVANSYAEVKGTVNVYGDTISNKLKSNTIIEGSSLSISGNTSGDIIFANTYVNAPRIIINSVVDANSATGYFSSVQTTGNMSVGGNFVLNGATVYNTNTFTISASAPNQQFSYIGVYRTHNGSVNGSPANSYIRWNETSGVWQLTSNNAILNNYYRILTDQQISNALNDTSSSNVASALVANTLNNNINSSNTWLQSSISTANTSMKSYVDTANTSMKSYVDTANTSMKSYVDTANTNNIIYTNGIVAANLTTAQSYTDTANTWLRANDAITLTSARSYTDTANTWLRANDAITLTSARSYTDTANTWLQANDSITLTSARSYTDTANTWLRANDATTLASAKSYTDTANTSMKSYIDNANYLMKSGGAITGTVTSPTAPTITSNTMLATTAFANNLVNSGYTFNHNITGSATNAGTVAGLSVHTGTNNEANKIVRTDTNGYLAAGYISSSDGNEGNNSSPGRVWGTNGSDNVLRSYMTSALSVAYAAGAGYASGAGNADTTDGYHFDQSVTIAAAPTFSGLTISSGTASTITMADSDEGNRSIHCNFNRIGFLTQVGVWGAWCADNGDWEAAGNVTAYSDLKLKKDIETISDALEKVKNMRGVHYSRIDIDQKSSGVIAQELQEVAPELVKENSDGIKSVAYGNIVGYLIEAIKEQQKQIEELKAKISQ